MDMMISCCSFNAYIFQERIFNKKYIDLNTKDALPPEIASSKARLIADMLHLSL